MQHLDEGTIHAWLDGQLPQDEAAAAEAHVAGCRPCADAVAEARGFIAASSRILMSLDGVPRDVAPKQPLTGAPAAPSAMDVMHAVASAAPDAVIDLASRAPATPRVAQRAPRRWFSAPSLAAAATIVVAVGTFALTRAGRQGSDERRGAEAQLETTVADSAGSPVAGRVASAAPAAPPSPALGAASAANEVQQRATPANVRAVVSAARAETDQ